MSGTSAVLEVEGLTTALRNQAQDTILEDVSFTLGAGEVLGIVGESGSGKSMLALTIMGLLPSSIRRTSGAIRLLGTNLAQSTSEAWRERRGRDMAMIFQEPMTSLNPVMRVGTQIEEVLRRRRRLSNAESHRKAIELLERVEIPSPAHPYSQALLASIPNLASQRDRLATIDGAVPTVGAMPVGCRFAPRCVDRRDACVVSSPQLRPLSPQHGVACVKWFASVPAAPVAQGSAR